MYDLPPVNYIFRSFILLDQISEKASEGCLAIDVRLGVWIYKLERPSCQISVSASSLFTNFQLASAAGRKLLLLSFQYSLFLYTF